MDSSDLPVSETLNATMSPPRLGKPLIKIRKLAGVRILKRPALARLPTPSVFARIPAKAEVATAVTNSSHYSSVDRVSKHLNGLVLSRAHPITRTHRRTATLQPQIQPLLPQLTMKPSVTRLEPMLVERWEHPRVSLAECQPQLSPSACLSLVLRQPLRQGKPLLLVLLEGVLADVSQFNSRQKVQLRTDAVVALKALQAEFQLVLLSQWELPSFLKVLEYFHVRGLYISAAYRLTDLASRQRRWFLDYAKVFRDFKILAREVPHKVLVLIPITSEVETPNDLADRLLTPGFHLLSAPVSTQEFPFSPVTVCVPHAGFGCSVKLADVVAMLKQVKAAATFYAGFRTLEVPRFVKVRTASISAAARPKKDNTRPNPERVVHYDSYLFVAVQAAEPISFVTLVT